MKSRSLALRTLLYTRRIILAASLESLTLIPFTLHCAMSFFFQLDRWDGTLEFLTMRQRIKELPERESMFPWNNTFVISSMFTPFTLDLTISFLLASSFRPMSISLGQLLSKSALDNLLPFRTILELSCTKG